MANLVVSMRENGFIGAIDVRAVPGDEQTTYQVVIGGHRLTAWRQAGGVTIPAVVKILTDDEADQIEIDENLVRDDLSALERAEHIAARLDIWKRRFPTRVVEQGGAATPKRGRPLKADIVSEFIGDAPATMGFAGDTGAAIGLNERTIRRALAVVRGTPAELRAKLHGTRLASNDAALRQLAALADSAEQAAVAHLLIEGRTKNVSDARAIAAGNEPSSARQTDVDTTVKAFRTLWKGAAPTAKAAILHELAGMKLPAGYAVTEVGS